MKLLLSLFTFFSPLAAEVAPVASSIYDLQVRTIDGHDLPLSAFRGRVMLIVNLASQCGFASQIAALESLHEKYGDHGLVILGFPSNDFMNQEPGTNQEILTTYQQKYGVSFLLLAKAKVTGQDRDPLWQFLTDTRINPKFGGPIYWNFTKFLVGKDGQVIARFNTITPPDDPKVITAIESALTAK